ncbi:hypothetical protein RHEC894_CH00218 [Rhizobium sp. CIAT894]|nr:hypothetical protein RHEC894_CH00218 [Rhizobium sp. CIAT894]
MLLFVGVLPQALFGHVCGTTDLPPEAWLRASLHGSRKNSPEIFQAVKICSDC